MKQRFLRLISGIFIPGFFIMAFCCIQGCQEPAKEATETTYDELKSWVDAKDNMTIIDVRPATDYEAGHIQDAINIDLSTFADTNGNLINDGEALTSVVPNKDKKIVAYCFGYGNDKIFADAAANLGYTNVYYYAGGTADWSSHGDYYVIEYTAFKAWHDKYEPFTDGKNYLIDDLPVAWYTGDDPSHPGGHIPGAVNIPVEQWVDGSGNLVSDGTAFTDVVKDKGAKVVIYCGNAACGKSLSGVKAAVKMGYTNVFRYQGGQQDWMDKGNALTPGSEP